eukprot:2867814-Prymnesium_polylepis.1
MAPGRGGDGTTARTAARPAHNQLARRAGTARRGSGPAAAAAAPRHPAAAHQCTQSACPWRHGRPALFGWLDCVAVRLSMLGGRA